MLGGMPAAPTKDSDNEAVRPVVIRMPAALHDALKQKAKEDERSMAQAIRFALRQYVQPTT